MTMVNGRAATVARTAAAGAVSLAAFAGIGAAQLAMAPHPAAHVRPTWDGYSNYPANGVMPLCPARDAGNGALLADGTEVECVVDGRGPHGPVYVWDAVSSR